MITLEEAVQNPHGGEWRSFSCPVHDDSNPSARVSVKTRKWVCMSCGAKGMAGKAEFNEDYEMRIIRENLDKVEQRKYPSSWWDRFDSSIPSYWLSRFTETAAKLYRLGFDNDKGKPCYPCWDDEEKLIGPVHRNLENEGPKYRYPIGAHTSQYLFGVRELVQSHALILVEGAMDVISVREAGMDAVGSYGSKLHPGQIKALKRLGTRSIRVAYDNDRAGRSGASEAVTALSEAGIWATTVLWSDDYNDLGEMDLETRKNVLRNT